jgi:hypothetical protein
LAQQREIVRKGKGRKGHGTSNPRVWVGQGSRDPTLSKHDLRSKADSAIVGVAGLGKCVDQSMEQGTAFPISGATQYIGPDCQATGRCGKAFERFHGVRVGRTSKGVGCIPLEPRVLKEHLEGLNCTGGRLVSQRRNGSLALVIAGSDAGSERLDNGLSKRFFSKRDTTGGSGFIANEASDSIDVVLRGQGDQSLGRCDSEARLAMRKGLFDERDRGRVTKGSERGECGHNDVRVVTACCGANSIDQAQVSSGGCDAEHGLVGEGKGKS